MSLIKHTIKYSDGSIYRGDVNEAKQPHGQGTLTYADGSVLECTWLYGKANGQGRLSDGKKQPDWILETTYADDYMQGKLVYRFGNTTYEGIVKDGYFDETGKLHGIDYSNASMKELDPSSGKYHVYQGGIDGYFNMLGDGTLRFSDGKVLSGTWKEYGKDANGMPLTAMSGKGRLVSPHGTVIEGMFENYLPKGAVVIRFEDETRKYGEQVFTGIANGDVLSSPDFNRCCIGAGCQEDHPYFRRLYERFRELVMLQGSPAKMGLDVTWDGELKVVNILDGSQLLTDTRMTNLMDVSIDSYSGTGTLTTANGKQWYDLQSDGTGRWTLKEADHHYFSEQLITEVEEGRYVVHNGLLFTPWENVRLYAVRKNALSTIVYMADNLRLVPKKKNTVKPESIVKWESTPVHTKADDSTMLDRFKKLLSRDGLSCSKVSRHAFRIDARNIDFMEIQGKLFFADPSQDEKTLYIAEDEHDGMKYIRSL